MLVGKGSRGFGGKKTMKKSTVAVAALSALAIILFSSGARAACSPFPKVSWWGNLTHGSVTQYVKVNHGGNWGPYKNKWQRQLNKLTNIQAKGGGIQAPNGSKVKGPGLAAYINQVRQRVSINDCLANVQAASKLNRVVTASGKVSAPGDSPDTVPNGDPQAGMAVAQQAGCFECHGANGRNNNAEVPNLAGQKSLYLVKQLMAFSSSAKGMLPMGEKYYRYHEFMSKKARELSPTEMDNIAAYFASL